MPNNNDLLAHIHSLFDQNQLMIKFLENFYLFLLEIYFAVLFQAILFVTETKSQITV